MDFDRLNNLIAEKGISKAFIASKLGKSRSLLTDWKNKKSAPSDCDLELIAELLNTTVDYLKGKTDIKNKPTTDNSDELTQDEAEFMAIFRQLSPEHKRELMDYALYKAEK